jgi:hypothetical protein
VHVEDDTRAAAFHDDRGEHEEVRHRVHFDQGVTATSVESRYLDGREQRKGEVLVQIADDSLAPMIDRQAVHVDAFHGLSGRLTRTPETDDVDVKSAVAQRGDLPLDAPFARVVAVTKDTDTVSHP